MSRDLGHAYYVRDIWLFAPSSRGCVLPQTIKKLEPRDSDIALTNATSQLRNPYLKKASAR
jgi:hypothetical protein